MWNASVRLKLRCSLTHGDPSSSIVSRSRATCSGSWRGRSSDRYADAVDEFPERKVPEVGGDVVVTAVTAAADGDVQPGRLRLDLDDVDQLGVTIQHRLDRRRERDPHAEFRPSEADAGR